MPVPRSGTGPAEPGRTILLAEDDEDLRALASKTLTREGFTMLEARDGQEAVELFELNRDSVCLALIDEVMPRMGGRAALARIRRIAPDLPAVLCIGYTWSLHGKMQECSEDFDCLPKPWQPRELLRVVREALDASRGRLSAARNDA